MFLDKFRLEKLHYNCEEYPSLINIDDVIEGVSQNENFIFYRHDKIIKIYDRVCDHNGGKLSLDKTVAKCPLHGWELDPSKGEYLNVNCAKEPLLTLNTQELDSPLVEINNKKGILRLHGNTEKNKVQVRFLNHACLKFNVGDKISFATDPWVIGSAFCNGWWLAKESPIDVFEALNDCDFIYISHNHPDHLHPESLKHIRKDMPFLTAGFQTDSTLTILKECGFTRILTMDFNSRLLLDKEGLSLSVLKSGDFRDDSGLLIEVGEFTCLLTVDSNFLNFGRLPIVDLLCSSFAGGASGFPLCFENYTEEEKKFIITRNRSAIKAMNKKNLQLTKPRYFMPYAGFFSEKAERDRYIKARNIKNSTEDYKKICDLIDCQLLDLNKFQIYEFQGKNLLKASIDETESFKDKPPSYYISNTHIITSDDFKKEIVSYFKGATLKIPLELEIICTDEYFENTFEKFYVNFNNKIIEVFETVIDSSELQTMAIKRGSQYLRLKIRREELADVILNGKPWEDLSIGFQCRIFREPNVYESDFWFYFTNIYIGRKFGLSNLSKTTLHNNK